MADTSKTAPTPIPVAKAVAKTQAIAPTPFAFRETKLRAGMIAHLAEFTPEGFPNEFLLHTARTAATALIDAQPEDINAVEVLIEASANPSAVQLNIIIFPKKL